MIDRAALYEALTAFVDATNLDAPDCVLRSSARVLAPFLMQIEQDAADELAADIRRVLEGLYDER
jgi:hypothetical protein